MGVGRWASDSSSTVKTPSTIKVDKVGDLTIKLVIGNGKDEKELTKTVSITGENGVATYTDIEFALGAGDETYERFFSFEEGKIFKDSEINATTGPKINLVLSQP